MCSGTKRPPPGASPSMTASVNGTPTLTLPRVVDISVLRHGMSSHQRPIPPKNADSIPRSACAPYAAMKSSRQSRIGRRRAASCARGPLSRRMPAGRYAFLFGRARTRPLTNAFRAGPQRNDQLIPLASFGGIEKERRRRHGHSLHELPCRARDRTVRFLPGACILPSYRTRHALASARNARTDLRRRAARSCTKCAPKAAEKTDPPSMRCYAPPKTRPKRSANSLKAQASPTRG